MFNYKLVGCDTDSIKICKSDGATITKEEMQAVLRAMNEATPDLINLEEDGYYDKFVVLKTKNYVTVKQGKYEYKGSSITDQKKEPALIKYLRELLSDIVENDGKNLVGLYNKYIKLAATINQDSLSDWTVKKTVTKAVLNPERLTERKVLDALEGEHIQEGDKVWVYNAINGLETKYTPSGKEKQEPRRVLKLPKNFISSDEIDTEHYIKRVYATTKILENIIDLAQFPKYHLKSNKDKLNKLLTNE